MFNSLSTEAIREWVSKKGTLRIYTGEFLGVIISVKKWLLVKIVGKHIQAIRRYKMPSHQTCIPEEAPLLQERHREPVEPMSKPRE
jgi:hypothetical protein